MGQSERNPESAEAGDHQRSNFLQFKRRKGNTMSREMKIGDKVLCIESSNPSGVQSGAEYTIDGFSACRNCGSPTLFLKEMTRFFDSQPHKSCGHRSLPGRETYDKSRFILPDLASLSKHRTEVSAKELLTITELQSQ